MKTLTTIKKDHLEFIQDIPKYIDRIKVLLHKESLDYSINEIDSFEEFVRKNISNSSQTEMNMEDLEKIFISYMGTAFLWHFGGEWSLDKSKSSSCYGQPYVVSYFDNKSYSTYIFPKGWFSILTRDQFKTPISDFYKNQIASLIAKKKIIKPVRNLK